MSLMMTEGGTTWPTLRGIVKRDSACGEIKGNSTILKAFKGGSAHVSKFGLWRHQRQYTSTGNNKGALALEAVQPLKTRSNAILLKVSAHVSKFSLWRH